MAAILRPLKIGRIDFDASLEKQGNLRRDL
jgi:hypothetical protein